MLHTAGHMSQRFTLSKCFTLNAANNCVLFPIVRSAEVLDFAVCGTESMVLCRGLVAIYWSHKFCGKITSRQGKAELQGL